jgi:hypothetical protein
LDRYRD